MKQRHPHLCVFLILLGLALAVFSGRLESSDEILMAMTARSLVLEQSLRFPETYGQTLTGYGVGTPLAATPFFLLEHALRNGLGLDLGENVSLLPLTNAALFALLGALLSGICAWATGKKLIFAPVLALAASPFLPASATLYSDVLAAVGVVGLLWALLPRDGAGGWKLLAAAAICAAFALMARMAVAPLVLLVIVWGWRNGSAKAALGAALAGVGAGIGVRLLQNWSLRGSPLAQGYDGQEFTTPLLVGLHGLLFSPERGLAIFWPLGLVALGVVLGSQPQRDTEDGGFTVEGADARARSLALLGLGALVFSVVFHAKFWTWHGGWTMGPRFLLPAMALAMPAVVVAISQSEIWSWFWRRPFLTGTVLLALAWSAWGAALYSFFSPIAGWNERWGIIGQIESRWLFEPQLSLWVTWPDALADEAMKPRWAVGVGAIFGQAFFSIFCQGFGAVILIAVALLWSARFFCRWLEQKKGPMSRNVRALYTTCVPILLFFILGFPLLYGLNRDSIATDDDRDEIPALRLRAPANATALLDLRPHGTYTFSAKANGLYRVTIDGETIMEQQEAVPQHLAQGRYVVEESGVRLLEVDFEPIPGREAEALFNLYWTWPGEGRLLESVGGEYVYPTEPGAFAQTAAAVRRKLPIAVAFGLALLLVFFWPGHRFSGLCEPANRDPAKPEP
ncbi:MAG: hypothetical protein RLY93_07325 [Sumerlaeia bacterium]